jgi:hypothetical protein
LIVRGHEVIQDVGLDMPGQPHQLRELPRFDARMAFLDMARRGPGRAAQRLAGCEVAPEVRTGNEQLDT